MKTAELLPSQATEDGIAPLMSAPNAPHAPSLHDYQLGDKLGEGGNAVVHRAVTRAGDVVAVKLIHKKLIDDPKFWGRFEREVRACTRLVHDNICRLYAHGETDGELWLAMELIDGGSLAGLIDRERRLPPQVAAVIVDDLLAALQVAHTAHILHRDIKPANIMLTSSGITKLVDFGIARGEGDAKVTETGFLVGTPAYMSPEQVTGQPIDHKSDLYAAGMVLYELLIGENPYARHAPSTALLKIATEPLPPILDIDDASIGVLDHLATSLMARRTAARPESAQAARHVINGFVGWVRSRHTNVVGDFLRDPTTMRARLNRDLFDVESERARALSARGNIEAAVLAWTRALAFVDDGAARAARDTLCARGGYVIAAPSEKVQRALSEAEAVPNNPTLWKRLADVARADGHLPLAVRGLRRWLAERDDSAAALQLGRLLGEGDGPVVVGGLSTRELVGSTPATRDAVKQSLSTRTQSHKAERTPSPAARSLTTGTTTERPPPTVIVAHREHEIDAPSKWLWLGAAAVTAVVIVVMMSRFTKDATKDAQRTLSENTAHVGAVEENDVERRADNKLLDARTALSLNRPNDVVLIVNDLTSTPNLRGAVRREALWLRAQAFDMLENRYAARKDYLDFLDAAPVTDPHYQDAKARIAALGAP